MMMNKVNNKNRAEQILKSLNCKLKLNVNKKKAFEGIDIAYSEGYIQGYKDAQNANNLVNFLKNGY